MKKRPQGKGVRGVLGARLSRRQVLAGAAAGGVAMLLGSGSVFAAGEDEEIRVGFLSPRSGDLGLFGTADPYVLGLGRKALAKGLMIHGKTYRITILDRDTQSSPSRASQLANELISKDHVQLMLATSTPEVTNPVADACEAAGVPNLATVVPWQSFYYARGAKPGQPSPFKWTYVFSFGAETFVKKYVATWGELPTNKKLAVLYPNDADGMSARNFIGPELAKAGYKIVDPGPYQDGTTDFSSQIALFKREHCQVFNSFALPPDFGTFWRQAATLHYTDEVIVASIEKAGQWPSQIKTLGALGNHLVAGVYWSPVFPYSSSLTGISSKQLGADYENATGQQWTEQVGATMSLLDAGTAVLKSAKDPTSKPAIRDAIATLKTTTMVGPVNFNTGPVPNVSPTPELGAQWFKAPPGSRFPMQLLTVANATDPNVPIQRKLVPYNQGR
ncbi:MAG TPA: ABC transporter substrate-binding protein [Nevskiaceae bacterium]